MFNTYKLIKQTLKTSWREYKDVFSVFIAYQLLSRIIGSLFFLIFNSFILSNIYNSGEVFENFDILSAFNFKFLIPVGFIYLIGSLLVFNLEFLGLICISKKYHEQKDVKFIEIIKEVFLKIPMQFKSLFLQILVYSGYILVFGILVGVYYSYFSVYIANILTAVSLPFLAFFIWSQWLNFIYVNFRLFENQKTVFSIFNYKLNLESLKELWISSILIGLFSVLVFLIYVIVIAFILLLTVFSGLNTYIISFIISTLLILSTIGFFCLSVFTNGVFTVYRSILYHKTFKAQAIDFERKNIIPGYFINFVIKFKKTITVTALLIMIAISGFQSIEINNSISKYVDEDFVIMAHRGGEGMENTINSIANSVENDIEAIEIDIQITKDGVPVLYHDEDLSKVDGFGNLNETLYTELEDLRYDDGQKIVSLDEVLETFSNQIRYNFELKTYDERNSLHVKNTLDVIRKYNIENPIYTSLNYDIVKILEAYNLETGLIITASVGDLNKFDTDWFIVNNIFYIANERKFDNSGKKLAIWSFDKNWVGDSAFTEAMDGAVTDKPVELNEKVKDYNKKPRVQKLIPSLLWLGEDKFLEKISIF